MHKPLMFAAVLCGCTHHPAPHPVEPQPAVAPDFAAKSAPEPADAKVDSSAPEASPCSMGGARIQLDACLAEIPPGGSFAAQEDAKPPFGYVCVFFGAMGRPRCGDGDIDVIRRWQDESDPECPKALTLYWAPNEGTPPVETHPVPDSHLRMRSFPSDGTQFSFIRLDDYIAEATSCLDAAQPMQAALTGWATRLMTERPPPNVSDPGALTN